MNNNQNRFLSGEGLKYCSACGRLHAFFACACTYVTILEAQAEHLTLCRCDSGLYLSSTFHIFLQTASQENIKSLYWTLMAKQDNYMKGSSCLICTLRMWGQNVSKIGLFRCLLSLFVSALPVSARDKQMK